MKGKEFGYWELLLLLMLTITMAGLGVIIAPYIAVFPIIFFLLMWNDKKRVEK